MLPLPSPGTLLVVLGGLRESACRLPPWWGAERWRDLSHESPAEEGPALPGLPSEAAEDVTRESHRQFRSDLSSTL